MASSAEEPSLRRSWLLLAAWLLAGLSVVALVAVATGWGEGPVTCGDYLREDFRGRFDEMYERVDRDHLFYIPAVDDRCEADEGAELGDVLDDMVRLVDEHQGGPVDLTGQRPPDACHRRSVASTGWRRWCS